MLSKKHYVEIAEILAACRTRICYDTYSASEIIDDIACELELYFKQDNPAFDVDKFNKVIYGGTKQ